MDDNNSHTPDGGICTYLSLKALLYPLYGKASFYQTEILWLCAGGDDGDDSVNDSVNEGVNGPVNGPVNGSVKSLSESLKQLYIVVCENQGLNTKQIAELLGRPATTVKKQLTTLRKKALIEHRDSDKTGGYYPVWEEGERITIKN